MHNNQNTPPPAGQQNFLPPGGGYQNLMAYQKAEIVYDATCYFTKRFFKKYDRTIDQMVQAARSGKQNIAEGSVVSSTSKEMELKLVNVARASLEELLVDYKDFARLNKIELLDKNDPRISHIRNLCRIKDGNYAIFKKYIESDDPDVVVNTIVTLIYTSQYLLSRLIKNLENDFLLNGGLRERMSKARTEVRKNQR